MSGSKSEAGAPAALPLPGATDPAGVAAAPGSRAAAGGWGGAGGSSARGARLLGISSTRNTRSAGIPISPPSARRRNVHPSRYSAPLTPSAAPLRSSARAGGGSPAACGGAPRAASARAARRLERRSLRAVGPVAGVLGGCRTMVPANYTEERASGQERPRWLSSARRPAPGPAAPAATRWGGRADTGRESGCAAVRAAGTLSCRG